MLPFALFALLVAFVPGAEQPAEVGRVVALVILVPLLFATNPTRCPRQIMIVATIVIISGLVGVVAGPVAERAAMLFDLAVISCLLALSGWARHGEAAFDRGLSLGVACGLALLAPLGLLQAWFGWDAPWMAQARPPGSLFANRNVAGELMVVAAPIAAWLAVHGTSKAHRGLGLIAASSGLMLVIATRSRAAIAAALFGSLVALAVCWLRGGRARALGRSSRGCWIALVLVLISAAIPSANLPSIPVAARTATRPLEGSGSVRLALARNTLSMIADRPVLGVGPGRWDVVYPLYRARAVVDPLFSLDKQPEHTEFDWLEYASEYGALSGLALIALFGLAIGEAVRREQWHRLAALIAISVHACLAFPLHSPASAALGFLLAGSSAAAGSRWYRVVALLLAAVGSIVGIGSLRSQFAVSAALADCSSASLADVAPWSRRDAGIIAARIFQCESEPARSLPALETALARQPHQLNLLLLSAARYVKDAQYDRAEELLVRALAIDSALGRAWLLRAMAQDGRGDRAGATASCEQAVRYYRAGPEATLYCSQRGAQAP
jgi:O-antigen ligase